MSFKLRSVDVTPVGEQLIASYLLEVEGHIIVVDTGPRSMADRVVEALEEEGARPSAIILTHIHLDHAGAAGVLAERYPGVPVYVHPRGVKHLASPDRLWEASRQVLGAVADLYGKPVPAPEDRLHAIEDGMILEFSGRRLRLIHTPGHASHHVSIMDEASGLMFVGDGAGVRVKVDRGWILLPSTPPPFRPDLYVRSLERMIKESPSDVVPGHYGSVGEGREYLKRHLEDFRLWLDAVKRAVSEGLDDVHRVAEYVADQVSSARLAYESSNPVVSQMFYMGTIWGLLEAVKSGSSL